MATHLEIAQWIPCTEVEGPFARAALWVQGCTLACPGCCNPGTLSRGLGRSIDVNDLGRWLAQAQTDHDVEGLTVLGGEPLQQLAGVAALAEQAQKLGLGVIVFTGYRHEQATALPEYERLWAAIDTLVDGPFDATQLERGPAARRFIGSRNQRLVHRTSRYRASELWTGAAGAELHVDPDGRVVLIGDPRVTRMAQGAMHRA